MKIIQKASYQGTFFGYGRLPLLFIGAYLMAQRLHFFKITSSAVHLLILFFSTTIFGAHQRLLHFREPEFEIITDQKSLLRQSDDSVENQRYEKMYREEFNDSIKKPLRYTWKEWYAKRTLVGSDILNITRFPTEKIVDIASGYKLLLYKLELLLAHVSHVRIDRSAKNLFQNFNAQEQLSYIVAYYIVFFEALLEAASSNGPMPAQSDWNEARQILKKLLEENHIYYQEKFEPLILSARSHFLRFYQDEFNTTFKKLETIKPNVCFDLAALVALAYSHTIFKDPKLFNAIYIKILSLFSAEIKFDTPVKIVLESILCSIADTAVSNPNNNYLAFLRRALKE